MGLRWDGSARGMVIAVAYGSEMAPPTQNILPQPQAGSQLGASESGSAFALHAKKLAELKFELSAKIQPIRSLADRRHREREYRFTARLPNGDLLQGDDGDPIRFNSRTAAATYVSNYLKVR